MVQVDIFWSYGLNAGLALAAGKALKNEPSFWRNPYFTLALAWTACIFAPSGIYLLWAFPGWETMFVARNHSSITPWLVCLFSLTNITQGVLGFWATWYFLRRGQQTAATLQTVLSHAGMAVILIVGWDGTGYKRFLYAGTGDDWHNQVALPWTDFFTSPVFFTLLGMGVVFLPTYFGLIRYFRRG
ncbi:MAG: hypothetical protein COT73_09160 [Bdellovibrio sp. CG10_big_fil_rev_8_21_14_0_10_47_8]|nr:MAG: hypothetical protein COT73_09160 [Bdellovibrio sp. CG10_big_fil_rev_8_21_14_0_10_47_8]